MSKIKTTDTIQVWNFNDDDVKKEKPAKSKALTKEEVIQEWDFSDDDKLAENEVLVKEWIFNDDEKNELVQEKDSNIDVSPNDPNEVLIKECNFNDDDKLAENEVLIKEWIFNDDEKNELVEEKDSIIDLDTRVKYMEKIEYIELTKLQNIDSSINFFPHPFDDGFYNLMESLETYGVLTPLSVIYDEDSDMYTVVTGRSRLEALTRLFKVSHDKKYSTAPCIILAPDTDPATLQSIVISTNLSYRKVPKDIQIKAVFMLDKILTNSKVRRNQLNITNIIADRAGVSRTTANTIRGFRNLSKKALELLFEDLLTREAARILSMIKSHDEQDMIIDKLGNQINDVSKLRALIEKPREKAKDIDVKLASPETPAPSELLEKKIEKELKKVPETTTIILKVNCNELEETLKVLASIRGKVAMKYQTVKDGDINNYFKITLNDNHRDQYLRNGFVTQETIDLVRSYDYKEIIKFV